ncbi:MAG: hypothetical protein M1358_17580 [Chloroflexi bacterium]|nr:hypothetical protein [Chloroflexota bacterium]
MEKTEDKNTQPTENQHKCLSCGTTSAARPLVCLEFKGEEKWVCVRCLPMLIHG